MLVVCASWQFVGVVVIVLGLGALFAWLIATADFCLSCLGF